MRRRSSRRCGSRERSAAPDVADRACAPLASSVPKDTPVGRTGRPAVAAASASPSPRGAPSGAADRSTAPPLGARNQVARLIGRGKQFRSLATRYEKRAESYRALWVIAMIILWLKAAH